MSLGLPHPCPDSPVSRSTSDDGSLSDDHDSHDHGDASSVGSDVLDMSDLLLPASDLEREVFGLTSSAAGDAGDATVVSTGSSCDDSATTPPEIVQDARPPSAGGRTAASASSSSSSSRRAGNGNGGATAVPEFLVHLLAMVRDPACGDLISWEVPPHDEPAERGGGRAGRGKVVVRRPADLQDRVLGRHFRHAKYASFQRQLNYFGFKKRPHDGKKGKLSPCSYVHERLGADPEGLLGLKRRPPPGRRHRNAAAAAAGARGGAGPAVGGPRGAPTGAVPVGPGRGKAGNRKRKASAGAAGAAAAGDERPRKAPSAVVSAEVAVSEAEASDATRVAAALEAGTAAVAAAPAPSSAPPPAAAPRAAAPAARSAPSKSLLDLLSVALPPPEVLFADDAPYPLPSSARHCRPATPFDAALVDLAMLY